MEIVIIHGFGSSPQEFMSIAENLPVPVEIISPPGHGSSEIIPSYAESADWLLEQLQDLRLHNYILYGAGLGGRIILRAILDKQELFHGLKGLILESTFLGYKTRDERREAKKKDKIISEQIKLQGLTTVLNNFYHSEYCKGLNENNINLLLQYSIRNSKDLAAQTAAVLGSASMPWSKDQLSKLNLPVLWISGEMDSEILTQGKEMSAIKENFILWTPQNSGKICHLGIDEKETMNEIINFIKGLV